MSEKFTVEKKYLHVPVKNQPDKSLIVLKDAFSGALFSYFHLAIARNEPDFTACYDLSAVQGQTLLIEGQEAAAFLSAVIQSDDGPCPGNDYVGRFRPQYHFSAHRGWLNDPNGLFFYRGQWHLFFQHNPFSSTWGNMHWGHAVGSDLIHWQERGDVLRPDAQGVMYSGSAVVDWHNTSGLQVATAEDPPILLFYTSAGNAALTPCEYTQGMAYSLDGGNTFKKYDHPILPCQGERNRDPKIVRHEPSQQWIMALYLGNQKETFGLYTSPDLLHWHFLQELAIENGGECPDFFPLRFNDDSEEKWLLMEANGRYLVGDFDGLQFIPETEPRDSFAYWGADGCYAGQTWSDAPDGRRLYIGWLRGDCASVEFDQSMTVPLEFSLRRFSDGARLCAWPVAELDKLRERSWTFKDLAPTDHQALTELPSGVAWDIEVEMGEVCHLYMKLCGHDIAFDRVAREVRFGSGKLVFPADEERLNCRILVDRNSVEIFLGCGAVWSAQRTLNTEDIPLQFVCGGYRMAECGTLASLKIHQLKSIWNENHGTQN